MMATLRARRARAYLNIDSKQVMWFVAALLLGLVSVSFAMSFNALLEVAVWTGLPTTMLWLVPLTIDSGIAIFTIAALVLHARARRWASAYAWMLMLLFTCLSMGANVMHAVDATTGEDLMRVITGAVLSGSAPFVVASASHVLALVVIEPADAPIVQPRTTASVTVRTAPSALDFPSRVTPVSAPVPVHASLVNDQIREALNTGLVPTGREIGDWLGGKSARTGQRHLARLTDSDPQLAELVADLTGAEDSTNRVTESWAVTA